MSETEVVISGSSGDTEIVLYADVVKNDLETVYNSFLLIIKIVEFNLCSLGNR